ncbi:hypothetical protein RCL_jg26926.t1 [Rhizophagus clarus]|uniref:Uncharacterized protein n=1 Tax=Rhizophagus clarus TaxID=94130 RepID=A0A8H3LMN5_9GLOM|nr:hypothetical protein RCL_jg26926.t1 [Rhizophagus clarus]
MDLHFRTNEQRCFAVLLSEKSLLSEEHENIIEFNNNNKFEKQFGPDPVFRIFGKVAADVPLNKQHMLEENSNSQRYLAFSTVLQNFNGTNIAASQRPDSIPKRTD